MIRRSISSASSISSAIEARQTSGTPRPSRSLDRVRPSKPTVGDPQPELGEQAEDPVPCCGLGLHQVHAAARALAQGAVLDRGQPELRDQITAAEHSQHPGVDSVGLAGERGDVADLAGVGDLHLPAGALQPVPDPDRAAHHLHTGLDLGAELQDQLGEPALLVAIIPSPAIVPVSPIAHQAARP